jgi:predicted dehydrogenase
MTTSPRDPLGIAIVGCGMISEFQCKAIRALPQARLAGFFDNVPELAQKRASEHGARSLETNDELLKSPDVDAVSICTPSGAHLEPRGGAARAGKR